MGAINQLFTKSGQTYQRRILYQLEKMERFTVNLNNVSVNDETRYGNNAGQSMISQTQEEREAKKPRDLY